MTRRGRTRRVTGIKRLRQFRCSDHGKLRARLHGLTVAHHAQPPDRVANLADVVRAAITATPCPSQILPRSNGKILGTEGVINNVNRVDRMYLLVLVGAHVRAVVIRIVVAVVVTVVRETVAAIQDQRTRDSEVGTIAAARNTILV